MKATYTPLGKSEIKLHDLGIVSLVGRTISPIPPESPQREVHTLTLRVDVFESNYDANLALLQSIQDAVVDRHGTLELKSDDYQTGPDSGTIVGEEILNRNVIVGPREPDNSVNAWGTYQQAITLTFRYEDHFSDTAVHQTATWKQSKTGAPELSLGAVHHYKIDYRTQRYLDTKDARSRSSGVVTMEGELRVDPTDSLTSRRPDLLTLCRNLEEEVNSKSGLLKFGSGSDTIFNKVVKTDAFTAEVNHAENPTIQWALSASFSKFPNESGFAKAEFRVRTESDKDGNEEGMTMSGKIEASTEAEALAKLVVLRALCTSYGFTAAQRVRQEQDYELVSNLDTKPDNAEDGSMLLTLSFNDTYRKRGSATSWSLSVSSVNDVRSGLVQETWSGWVVASGADADAAYAAAEAKARLLGDEKRPIQIGERITRTDHQTSTGPIENLRVEFSFEYQTKSARLYMEYTVESDVSDYQANMDRCSGYVVAVDMDAARSEYENTVKTQFAGAILDESTEIGTMMIKPKEGEEATIQPRLAFRFSVHKPKTAGTHALKYELRVELDYLRLTQSTSVNGILVGGNDVLDAVEAGTAGNALDLFLATFGTPITVSKSSERLQKNSDGNVLMAIGFQAAYVSKLSVSAQVLASEVQETIQYTGTRWAVKTTAGGKSLVQNTGHAHGSRTISGKVTGSTEAACMAAVRTLINIPFASGANETAAPSVRYKEAPQITRNFVSLPLSPLTSNRAGGMNAVMAEVTFQRSEHLVDHQWVE